MEAPTLDANDYSGLDSWRGEPPVAPGVCPYCARAGWFSEDNAVCQACKQPVAFLGYQDYLELNHDGYIFVYVGKKKHVGPIVCPRCGSPTTRKMLEEHNLCASCRRIGDGKKRTRKG